MNKDDVEFLGKVSSGSNNKCGILLIDRKQYLKNPNVYPFIEFDATKLLRFVSFCRVYDLPSSMSKYVLVYGSEKVDEKTSVSLNNIRELIRDFKKEYKAQESRSLNLNYKNFNYKGVNYLVEKISNNKLIPMIKFFHISEVSRSLNIQSMSNAQRLMLAYNKSKTLGKASTWTDTLTFMQKLDYLEKAPLKFRHEVRPNLDVIVKLLSNDPKKIV